MTSIYKAKCPTKLLYVMLLVFLTSIFVLYFTHEFTTDVYFLIATGRHIIENGIPVSHPFSSGSIIVQQWLHCVYVAFLYDHFGITGYWISILIPLAMLGTVVCIYFKMHKVSLLKSLGFCLLLMTFNEQYVCVPRPEAITLTLLVIEMIVLEKYIEKRSVAWLAALPVLTVIEMNVHMSMWPVHVAILLAYSVPMPKIFGLKKNTIGWQGFLVGMIMTCMALFVNPYGIDGIMYLPRFYIDHAGILPILECEPPKLLSRVTVILIVGLALWLFFKPKSFTTSAAWMSIGFSALAFLAYRNLMFLPLMFLPLLPALSEFIDREVVVNMDKQRTWFNFAVLALGTVFISTGITNTGNAVESRAKTTAELVSCIEDKDEPIYVGFNKGAVLEFLGFTNVYMDARPELYTSSYGVTTLYDYASLISGVKIKGSRFEAGPWTDEDIAEWIDYNGFVYMFVDTHIEPAVAVYLNGSDDWKLIETTDDGALMLYEKADRCDE